jgi:thioredoxin-dependent peroxiredoxin
VVGSKLGPGGMVPAFELDYFDPVEGEMKTVRFSDSAGSVRLLNVINSLDTPVCHVETHRRDAPVRGRA